MDAKKAKIINDALVRTFDGVLKVEQAALRRSRFHDLSVTEMHTIQAIGPKDARSMGEVAAKLGVRVATLSACINKLVRKGYVVRRRDEKDRRVVLIELTHTGKVADRMHGIYHSRMIRYTLADMSDTEQDALIKALDKLSDFFAEDAAIAANKVKMGDK